MTSLMDEGKAADVVFIDFIKAFDTVSHYSLTDELDKVDIEYVDSEVDGKLTDEPVTESCGKWYKVHLASSQ